MIPVAGRPWCVLDLETTGLTPGWNEILEVSAIRIDPKTGSESRIQIEWRPLHCDRISDRSLEINGWSPARWGSSPHPLSPIALEQFGQLMGLLAGCYVVGHNVRFDLDFLRGHFGTHNMKNRHNRSIYDLSMPRIRGEIDTVAICWLLLGDHIDRLSLDHIRQRIPGLPGIPHTSMGDCETVIGLLRYLLDQVEEKQMRRSR